MKRELDEENSDGPTDPGPSDPVDPANDNVDDASSEGTELFGDLTEAPPRRGRGRPRK
jgi:hypothetical protein